MVLWELAALFARLGATAFGGPAAHIAMMQDEVVARRRWLSEERFLDLLGATNLIPGPNSTEMAMHIGWERARGRGLVVAGLAFIVPAVLVTLAVAWVYVRYGRLPEAGWVLYGVKPVIVGVVVQAIAALAPKAMKGPLHAAIGVGAALLAWLGVHELVVLLVAALASIAGSAVGKRRREAASRVVPPLWPLALASAAAPSAVSLPGLFWVFFKTGSVLFGSGYVLLAFLRADLVERLAWMTEAQLIDAIAVGQITPGPVFTTATFIGYLLGGPWGAALATTGIFLPAFLFVAVSGPLVPRLRRSELAAALLDGVNVASLALMAVVTARLARAAIVDVPTVLLAVVAAGLLLTLKPNSTWLILGGAVAGYLLHAAG